MGRSRRRRRPEAKRQLPEMVATFKPSTDIADLREHLNAVAAMTGGYGPALDLMNDAGRWPRGTAKRSSFRAAQDCE